MRRPQGGGYSRFIAATRVSLCLLRLPRSPQGATGLGAGMLAIFNDLHAIYKDVLHPDSVLVRFLECRAVRDCRRIKHNHVGKHSLLEKSAVVETEIGSWLPTQAVDRIVHRQNFLIAHVFPEHAREISVSARMRIRFRERWFGRL